MARAGRSPAGVGGGRRRGDAASQRRGGGWGASAPAAATPRRAARPRRPAGQRGQSGGEGGGGGGEKVGGTRAAACAVVAGAAGGARGPAAKANRRASAGGPPQALCIYPRPRNNLNKCPCEPIRKYLRGRCHKIKSQTSRPVFSSRMNALLGTVHICVRGWNWSGKGVWNSRVPTRTVAAYRFVRRFGEATRKKKRPPLAAADGARPRTVAREPTSPPPPQTATLASVSRTLRGGGRKVGLQRENAPPPRLPPRRASLPRLPPPIPHCFTTWVRSLWKMTRPRHHPFAQQRPCRASSGGGARPPPRQTQGVSTPADAPAAARARRVGNQWRATLWPGMPPRVAGPWSRSVWTIRLARRPGAPAQRTHPSSGGVAERNLSPDSRRQPRLAAATVSVYWTRPGSQRECQQRQKRERIVYGEVAVGTEQQHPRVVARVWHARVGFV